MELSDGSIRFNVRRWAGKPVRKTSVSTDGGVTWSPVEDAPRAAGPELHGIGVPCPQLHRRQVANSVRRSSKYQTAKMARSSSATTMAEHGP